MHRDRVRAQTQIGRDFLVRFPVHDHAARFRVRAPSAPDSRSPFSASGFANCGSRTVLPAATPLHRFRPNPDPSRFSKYIRARRHPAPGAPACLRNAYSASESPRRQHFARICRVASMPLMPGNAQSITMTRGFSCERQLHRFVAVARFADHVIVGLVFEHPAKSACAPASDRPPAKP